MHRGFISAAVSIFNGLNVLTEFETNCQNSSRIYTAKEPTRAKLLFTVSVQNLGQSQIPSKLRMIFGLLFFGSPQAQAMSPAATTSPPGHVTVALRTGEVA